MSEHSQHMEHERGSWGSNFGFLMAAVGSAVGLGNIWGFPYKMGSYGGFAFLVIYLLLVIFVGVVVMLGELSIGRKTGLGAVGAYAKLGKKYKWIGLLGILAAFCLLAFYNVLGGLVMRYMFGFILQILGVDGFAGQSGSFFGYILHDYSGMVFFHVLFIVCNVVIVMGGIQGGIEKFCTVAMPALFFMLLFVIIYVAFQPGAGQGYKDMLTPNFEPISSFSGFLEVLSKAAGQMFFSLSLGMGAIISYGSYLDKKENLQKNAIIIVVMDTLVALMAGLCVIPGRFALDPTGKLGGPSLLFVTMQNVFDRMGAAGPIFGILFYLLVVFAAVSSSISLLEAVVAHFVDKARDEGKGDKRKLYSLIGAIGAGILCVIVCLDALGNAGISPADILGMRVDPSDKVPTWSADWLDFFDCIAEGILMPLGALLMSIMYGWELGPEVVHAEATREGQKFGAYGWFRICIKYITPLAMLLVLYGQIKEFFF